MAATDPLTPPSTPQNKRAMTSGAPPRWGRAVKQDVAQGKAAAMLGWRFVRLHPAVLFWRSVGVGVEQALFWLTILVCTAPLFGSLMLFQGSALERISAPLTSTRYWVGCAAVLASATLATWLVDALTRALVWRASGLDVRPQKMSSVEGETAWPQAARLTPRVLLWVLFRKAVVSAGALLFLGVYVGLIQLQTLSAPPTLQALMIALLYSAAMIYAGLVAATIEWYPARHIVTPESSSGEQLLHAAWRALSSPLAIYRLFLHSILPALPFVLLSFGLGVGKLFAVRHPDVYNLLNALDLFAGLVSFVALIASAIAFRAGSVHLEAFWERAAPSPEQVYARHKLCKELLAHNKHNPLHRLYQRIRGATGEEHLAPHHFIPPVTPHRFSFALLDDLERRAPHQAHEEEEDAP